MADSLTLSLHFEDEDGIELQAAIAVGEWAGIATGYTTREALARDATALAAFARTATGEATLDLGTDNGTGFVSLRAFPRDRAKHLAVEIALTAKSNPAPAPSGGKLRLTVATEAAAFDKFIGELTALARKDRSAATLAVRAL